jgi:hypothetical protein
MLRSRLLSFRCVSRLLHQRLSCAAGRTESQTRSCVCSRKATAKSPALRREPSIRVNALPARWYFCPAEGGILCGVCAQSRKEILPLGAAALAALIKLQEEKREERINGLGGGSLPVAVLKEIRFLIQRFLQFHMEREIRSAAFIAKFVAV